MPRLSTPADILTYARDNNWLPLSSSEGNILTVFLTPAGNMLEVYCEKNKVTLKTLSLYVAK